MEEIKFSYNTSSAFYKRLKNILIEVTGYQWGFVIKRGKTKKIKYLLSDRICYRVGRKLKNIKNDITVSDDSDDILKSKICNGLLHLISVRDQLYLVDKHLLIEKLQNQLRNIDCTIVEMTVKDNKKYKEVDPYNIVSSSTEWIKPELERNLLYKYSDLI